MNYTLKLYDADASPAEHRAAEARFREVLETTLGAPSLVAPVYLAYQRLVAIYGEQPDPDSLNDAERELFTQWQAAESAAVTAAFGSHRYMGDAMYEIAVYAARP